MDALKLLSRATNQSKRSKPQQSLKTPSSGRNAQPQLFPPQTESDEVNAVSRKRKRGQDVSEDTDGLDFFGGSGSKRAQKSKPTELQNGAANLDSDEEEGNAGRDGEDAKKAATRETLSLDERKRILREHKVKVAWLNPPAPQKRDRRKGQDKKKSKITKVEKESIFPEPLQSFSELRSRYGISGRLAANIDDQGYTIPTEVQLGTLPLLVDDNRELFSGHASTSVDLLTVAPTGSGKTLAFMIPLLHKIIQARRGTDTAERHTSAVILAPTKELASQIVNEGRKLAHGTGVKVTQLRKGMKLTVSKSSDDAEDLDDESGEPVVKSDVLVSTPGLLAGIIGDSQGSSPLSGVCHLVLDEADVLLDPLFREQTLAIWNSLPHSQLRVSLWSATMGSNIEELAKSTIDDRLQKLGEASETTPIVRVVVGLKDSAVPNVEHRLIYAASEQGKLMGLRQLLHPATSSTDSGPPLLPPFLVFTQTIERAVALHSELLYDIPAEAGGIGRIAVLHSDLSDTARDSVMSKFRKGEIWVLITTDLLSRGVDFRGVNGVVNYDIPTSSAAYVHRVGRTGRAGREGGVAVTLYSKEDIPYLKPIANLIATAQKLKGSSDEGVQPWLLDALPTLSKKAKQDLKKRGVEARTSRGAKNDPKAARKARISTKSGFVRREENKRKGAILGSQKRQIEQVNDAGDETDFGGFD